MNLFKLFQFKSPRNAHLPNILMFHLGRCGSTVIGNLLDQSRCVKWNGELMHGFWRNNGQVTNVTEGVKYLEEATLRKSTNTRIVGEEIKLWELEIFGKSIEWAAENLTAQNPSIVLLTRTNLLRKLVSSIRAVANDRKFHTRADSKVSLNRVHIPFEPHIRYAVGNILEILASYDRLQRHAEEWCRNEGHLIINYEADIQEDPLVALNKICENSGISGPKVPLIRFQRTNPEPLCEIVINYSEVCSWLEGSPFSTFLVD